MAEIKPALKLACGICGHRPDEGSVMEAFMLHSNVEHDTADYQMQLVAVCTCGATMKFIEQRPTGGGHKDYFTCVPCGNTGWIRRNN